MVAELPGLLHTQKACEIYCEIYCQVGRSVGNVRLYHLPTSVFVILSGSPGRAPGPAGAVPPQ